MQQGKAITVEGISKAYLVGEAEQRADTFAETAWKLATAPLRNLRQLRRLDTSRAPSDARVAKGIAWALRDVSFTVDEGEVLGVIGRNGAGKSTLLKVLSRITEPTSGIAHIHGRVSCLLEVGTGFHPELTGRENIYMNGTILGMRKREIDRKFDEIVDFSGVEAYLDTPIKRYSSGMQVRLAFSVAAHLEPEILIVDEVLAVGDAEFQSKCLGKMKDVSRSGRTVLLVSHNMGAIESLCDRCIVMHQGQLATSGPPREAVATYLRLNKSTDLVADQEDSAAFFRSVEIHSGDLQDQVRMGDPVTFRVRYRCSRPPRDLRIGILVEGALGHRLLNLSPTYQAPRLLAHAAQEGEIECTLDAVMFTPGTYFVSLLAKDASEKIAELPSAKAFDVIPSDVYRTGQIPTPDHGLMFSQARWEYQPQVS